MLIQILLIPIPGEKPLDGNFIKFIADLSVYGEHESASVGMTMGAPALCGGFPSVLSLLVLTVATVKATVSFSLQKPVKKKNTVDIHKTDL